ncbi:hypothetical protein AMECASPLE_035222 [Ameca splendens]|uniref:Uncharacterized protein n=1 Tax=Ameca splendens TaxID=208324 RepID=A0ABV0YIS1_9TELE
MFAMKLKLRRNDIVRCQDFSSSVIRKCQRFFLQVTGSDLDLGDQQPQNHFVQLMFLKCVHIKDRRRSTELKKLVRLLSQSDRAGSFCSVSNALFYYQQGGAVGLSHISPDRVLWKTQDKCQQPHAISSVCLKLLNEQWSAVMISACYPAQTDYSQIQ